MPTLTITRAGGWADRFRPYTVVIDGQHRDLIRLRESRSYEVSPGSHHVRLLAGLLYGSPALRVHIDARGVSLACGCDKRPSAFWRQMARPDTWIWLRAEPV